ncbi:AMP-binding enzyme [Kitasatospora albolonga]
MSEDGTLDFLGRLDDQVKVRGNRVEPGEIEAVLQTHPDITQAVVLLHGKRLTAFVTPRPGTPGPDPMALRLHLAQALPPYMLPSRITTLDKMPLTAQARSTAANCPRSTRTRHRKTDTNTNTKRRTKRRTKRCTKQRTKQRRNSRRRGKRKRRQSPATPPAHRP